MKGNHLFISYFQRALIVVLIVLFSGSGLIVNSQTLSDDGWKDFGPGYSSTQPVKGGIFKSAYPKYVGLMNPNHWPVNDWITLAYIYGRLVLTGGDYRASVPYLVKSWKYLDPVTAVTELRRGAKYHDGSNFNASALKYQFEWIQDKKNGCWNRAYLNPVKSIEIVNDHTLKWHFHHPWATFAETVLSGVPGFPISAEALKKEDMFKELKSLAGKKKNALKKVKKAEKKATSAKKAGGGKAIKAAKKLKNERKKLDRIERELAKIQKQTSGAKSLDVHPVGTGAYMFEEGRPGNYLKLKRNPNWWFAKHVGKPEMPYFDGWQVMVIPDPSVQLANLRAGKIHTMEVDKSLYQLVKKDPNLNIHTYPLNSLTAFLFNHIEGPCKDIRVRKAISHAIDRKALIHGTQFGLVRMASCMLPEDNWFYNPDLKPVAYNPELSKKLLVDAGYGDGLAIKGYLYNDPGANGLATAVKGMLQKVGVDWKVDFLDRAAANNRLQNREYDLADSSYPFILDPDRISSNLYHPAGGFNHGRSKNGRAIPLIEAGRRELDPQKRKRIYQDIQKELYDNYEDVWLWWGTSVVAYQKKVQGFNRDMYIKYRDGFQFTHPLWFKDGK